MPNKLQNIDFAKSTFFYTSFTNDFCNQRDVVVQKSTYLKQFLVVSRSIALFYYLHSQVERKHY